MHKLDVRKIPGQVDQFRIFATPEPSDRGRMVIIEVSRDELLAFRKQLKELKTY